MDFEVWETTKIFIDGDKIKFINNIPINKQDIREISCHSNGQIKTYKHNDFYQEYDDRGNMTYQESRDSYVRNTYDDKNRTIRTVNSKGEDINYMYDENNKIIKI